MRDKLLATILYMHGLSLNAIARLFNVSAPAVLKWVRNFARENYEKPKPGSAVVMEVDEMWHYLQKKNNKLWIWKAYCRDTGQLVDWECGDRDGRTFRRLMKRLLRWNVEIYCVDHWKVYPKEMPAGCRYLQSKAETVALERNNSRQRHWFARFRRKSIVVSKSKEMVDLTMALFAKFYVNSSMMKLLSLLG